MSSFGSDLNSTSLQLARLVERVTRNFGEKRLTGAVFLDVAKAFDTVWVDGLVYKRTVLNFPSYLVRIITSYLRGVIPNCHILWSWNAGWSGLGWNYFSRPLQPVCK
jgi:hypothetical protein